MSSGIVFSSCSTKKDVKKIKKKDVIIPEHSLPQQKEEEELTYEDAVKKHHKTQSDSAKQSMKDNKKRSKKDTPLRKRKSFPCF